MKVFIADEVGHFNEKKNLSAIYSLHVHPLGKKLATGSQDYNIKIWDLDIVFSQMEPNPLKNPLLSTLSAHKGPVLCVRWSSISGQYLASAGDDSKICIWEQVRCALLFIQSEILTLCSASRQTGNLVDLDGEGNVERYRVKKELFGHQGGQNDVADLAWSPDNSYLASCGFDGKVCIWNGSTFEKIIALDCHEGFVKGVSWDPVGKYLATQGDDKFLKIWRISDWGLEHEVSEPYRLAASTTFFRRLSWSPEGSYIVTVNGESGSLPIAPLVDRGEEWNCDSSLVGHQGQIEVGLFNPKLFKQGDQPTGDFVGYCALGSQDCGVSLWSTKLGRAMINIKALFRHTVLDLSWTPDGFTLLASSYDGHVAVLRFSSNELGTPVSEERVIMEMSKYGYQRNKVIIAETPAQLQLEEEYRNSSSAAQLALPIPQEAPSGPSIQPVVQAEEMVVESNLSSKDVSELQTVSVKGGKKRITPVTLKSVSNVSEARQSNLNIATVPQESSVRGKESIEDPARKRKQPTESLNASGSKRQQTSITASDVKLKYVMPTIISTTKIPKLLAIPTASRTIAWTMNKDDQTITIQCENNMKQGSSKITCSSQSKVFWTDFLQSVVIHVKGTNKFTAISCADGTLYIYSPAGRRILPCIALESAAKFLDCSESHLMVITALGNVSVWDITKKKSIVSRENMTHLLKLETGENPQIITIVDAAIKPFGSPQVVLSDGSMYLFELDLREWVRVWEVESDSLEFSKARHQKDQLTTFSILENKICAFLAGKQPNEFRDALHMYARKLADEGALEKVIELCDELLGPPTT
ncbi:HIR complex subunit [Nowakowskiella sp. JEL0407]|nr:HIR complex subunit [Nowakowskiella sp. JEL0407]